ncbi:hypothetical protein N7G274_000198 [Stereocaulon virgatum]|uniref:Uncharacterized protein n=1 Tax=Stereocaulon virgatum TaxID=373712 RepID=A0ABR4ATV6_9LECA
MAGWKGKAFVRVKESRGGRPSWDPLLGGTWNYIRIPGGGRVDRAVVRERFRNGNRNQPRHVPPDFELEQGGVGEPQNAPLPAQDNHLPQGGGGQRRPPPEREGFDGNESEISSDGEPGGQVVEEPQAANPPSRRSRHGVLRNNNNANGSRQAAAASHVSRNQGNALDTQSIRSNATAPIHDEHSVHGSQIAANASVRSAVSNNTSLGRHGRRVAGGNAGPAPRVYAAAPGHLNAPVVRGVEGRGPLPHGQARFEEASRQGRRAASFFNADELRAWNEPVQLPPGMTREQLMEKLLAEPPHYPGPGRYNSGYGRFGV